MSKLIGRRGGFISSAYAPRMAAATAATVPEASYLDRIRVGNDQGQDGACALFAIASWATVRYPERRIPNAERLALYADVIGRIGGEGLTAEQAFAAAVGAGWLPGIRSFQRVGNLQPITKQPMLAAYRIGDPWANVSKQGCLDHAAPLPPASAGLHLVLIAATGNLAALPGREWIYIENSWGLDWGWNGIGVLRLNLHSQMLHSLYILE